MNLLKRGFALLSGLLVVTSVWMPFVVRSHTRAKLAVKAEQWRQGVDQVAQLSTEHQRLSNLVAQVESAQTISADQLSELLRLRGGISRLREQASAAQTLREENHRLQERLGTESGGQAQSSGANFEERLSAEVIDAGKAILRELPAALQRYGSVHSNQPPSGFPELRDYFPVTSGGKMAGLYTFDFLRDHLTENGLPQPGDALILREDRSRSQLDGTHARVYGFSDGTVTEVKLPGDDFDPWEKQHISLAPPRAP